jgi:hypothetical protein
VCLILLAPNLSLAQPQPPKKITIEEVRPMVRIDPFERWEEYDTLVALDAAAFPVYDAILADPNHTSNERMHIFVVVAATKADGSRYRELAIKSLSHPDETLRIAAVRLLAKIGSEQDTAPIVALLSDEDHLVVVEAAKTLATIGGWRDLVAFEAWLRKAKARKFDPDWTKGVEKARDALKKRLDDAENRKAPPPRLVGPRQR